MIKTCSTCRLLDQSCRFPRIQEDDIISTCTGEALDIILSAAASVHSICADCAEGMGRLKYHGIPYRVRAVMVSFASTGS
jgi:hypothetical protein